MTDDFFQPPPPRPPEPEEVEPRQPWTGQPNNVLGALAAASLMLTRTEEVTLAIDRLTAYPDGFELRVVILLRRADDGDPWMRGPFPWQHPRREGELRDDFLRFGMRFPDGTKLTNVGGNAWGTGGRPDHPVLLEQGGGGGGTRWEQDYWVWPLPTAGRMEFVCEWPAKGIALTRVPFDAGSIVEAASRAVTLWPEEPPENGSRRLML